MVLGILVQFGGMILIRVVTVFALAAYLGSNGELTTEQLMATLRSTPVQVVYAASQLALALLSGVVAVKVSRGINLRPPILVGLISFLLNLGSGWPMHTVNQRILLAVIFAVTLIGGKVGLRRKPKDREDDRR